MTLLEQQTALRREQADQLSSEIQALWERTFGTRPDKVWTLMGSASIAVWVEHVLPHDGEQHIEYISYPSYILDDEIREQLNVVQVSIASYLQAVLGRHIVSRSIRPDLDTGKVLFFFVLGWPCQTGDLTQNLAAPDPKHT